MSFLPVEEYTKLQDEYTNYLCKYVAVQSCQFGGNLGVGPLR